MFKVIGLILALGVVGILGFAAAQPDTFRIERTVNIKAAPEKIFTFLADFHQWAGWSPFEKMDSTMQKTFSGATSGKGSVYAWAGKGKSGTGRMEITDFSAPNRLAINLDFYKPFEAHNVAEFTLVSKGGMTEVTWAMFGPSSFTMKILHLFMNMDKMVGKDFSAGLENLKTLVEK
ncbi:MAG: SRPBCC family protein [Candidatus Firestonebacteria bacterium]|nr:SRPBCC family protein [Candidatus Firestonebacteria bacterium]